MQTLYNQLPKVIGQFNVNIEEYFTYTYLPVKFPGMTEPVFEKRMGVFAKLIGVAACDFIGSFGLDRYIESYVYITAKHMYQKETPFNRPGYHSDGFLTDDISYIFSNSQPTIFNSGPFFLSNDDKKSLDEMKSQSKIENELTYPDNTLLRLNQFVIHKVGKPVVGPRIFFKMCFSKDKYDLAGNSHNFLLDYEWQMRPRSPERNVPQEL
jgi:hypothetical protein